MERNLPDHDNNQGYRLYVIFAEGPTLSQVLARPNSLHKKIRLCRRYPWLIWQLLGGALISLVIRSRVRHVLISDGVDVLDYRYRGATARTTFSQIESHYRGLFAWAEVTSPLTIDISHYERADGRPNWIAYPIETILRIAQGLSMGLIQGSNCVTQARKAMAAAAVNVPRTAHTPPKLMIWMIENGYDLFAFEPTKDS